MTRSWQRLPGPDLPLYLDQRENPTLERVFGGGPDAVICRVPELIDVDRAYAIYADGLSMIGVIEPGDVLFINTAIPVTPGKLVITLPSSDDGIVRFGRLAEMDGEKIVLHQEFPEEDITLDQSDVETMDVIQYIRKFS